MLLFIAIFVLLTQKKIIMTVFNKKEFLLPNSHRSMSTYHAKVMDDGIMKLTMHDCKHSIQLKNNLNNSDEVVEALEKLTCLADGILELRDYIRTNYSALNQ